MADRFKVYEKVDRFIQKSKIPMAYILFIYATSVQYIPDSLVSKNFKEISLLPVAITLGIIVLRIFFDIYKKIHEPDDVLPFFNKWKDVTDTGEFSKIFKKRLHDDKIIDIKIIGISLRFHWSYIRNLLDDYILQDKNVEFRVTIAILDPDAYDTLKFVDDPFRDKFEMNARATVQDVVNFMKSYHSKERATKCTIALHRYQFMPSFYGISLDDKFLFLGNTYWGETGFRAAGQSYNLYREDDDFSGSERIKVFNSWIDYIKENDIEGGNKTA